ncbi:hypothetical protein C7C46_27675 [Streptomyces tateyamensis]|uniref:Uncharacterized protein n=1 Tax=Streptomyces tateyamensis TaxID=565073 RepID=A0A2V4NJ03_9ACTN|nr:hypothetical protein C7C46_27675 [Streptomyces tateyamensis]
MWYRPPESCQYPNSRYVPAGSVRAPVVRCTPSEQIRTPLAACGKSRFAPPAPRTATPTLRAVRQVAECRVSEAAVGAPAVKVLGVSRSWTTRGVPASACPLARAVSAITAAPATAPARTGNGGKVGNAG